jgi:hypothetical protein
LAKVQLFFAVELLIGEWRMASEFMQEKRSEGLLINIK